MQTEFSDSFIKIRRYDVADIPLLYEAARESVVEGSKWLPWLHSDYSMAESLEWVLDCCKQWDQNREYNFVIVRRRDDRFLGGVGINQINVTHRIGNLGYWVRSTCTNRGIATAAARLAAQFGFKELQLCRLEILVAVDNLASQRVAEKAGARREGILRNRLFIHGRSIDATVFSLIPPTKIPLEALQDEGTGSQSHNI
jgi:ribosomal-protein-serine acetyltransferase